jgi:hypothetical protein
VLQQYAIAQSMDGVVRWLRNLPGVGAVCDLWSSFRSACVRASNWFEIDVSRNVLLVRSVRGGAVAVVVALVACSGRGRMLWQRTDPRLAACAALLGAAVTLAAGYRAWSTKPAVQIPQCSVPEILHALAHGDETVRALAGRALRSVMFGEVDVLEDLLDDVAGKHAQDFGRRRADGRTLLDIAVGDAAAGDADALSLLLAVTELDDNWDVEEDEWNVLVIRARAAVGAVKTQARTRDRMLGSQARKGVDAAPGLARAAACLARRLEDPTLKLATPPGFRQEDDTLVPEPLSFNTRARCAVCGKGVGAEFRCGRCRNVTYCCAAHRALDATRHGYWCR